MKMRVEEWNGIGRDDRREGWVAEVDRGWLGGGEGVWRVGSGLDSE